MLTRIRNANAAGKDSVDVPYSKLKKAIADVLKEEGYIRDCYWSKKLDGRKRAPIRIYLKYADKHERVIHDLQRVSKPGIRRYAGVEEIAKEFKVLGGLGIAIISTSRGIMTDATARRAKVGGEVLAVVW
jgi:small subunit ribosomal protein S8